MKHFVYISKIYDYMHLHKMNQKQFAQQCGITYYRLRKILKNDIKSIVFAIDKVANGMRIDRADLIDF